MKLVSTIIVACSAAAAFAAEPLWKLNGIASVANKRVVAAESDGSLKAKFNCWIVGKTHVPVDSSKRYRISCEVKGAGQVRVGVTAFDKDKRPISIVSVLAVKGSETELTAPLKKGDTVIKVKDTSKWNPKIPTCIVFDADPSGEMKDIPNIDLFPGRIKGITANEILLAAPSKIELPAGTVIRQHRDSRRAIFSRNQKISADWKTYQFIIIPGLTLDGSNSNKFYPGVAFVAPLVVTPKGALVRNLQIEVME